MKFCWCTLSVSNLEESIQFYHEIVGLPIGRRLSAWPDISICFMGEGRDEIELLHDPRYKPSSQIEGITVAFEVDSTAEKIQFLKEKGIEIESGPFQPNPHIRFFNVRDPNGLRIQFVEKIMMRD